MTEISNRKSHIKQMIQYCFSFLVPIVIMAIALVQNGVCPGGQNTILIYDMRCEVVTLYSYLSNHNNGFNNLFYSISQGLGGGFWGTFSYILSPLDLIYIFVPAHKITDVIYFMTLLRTGLSGLFFSIFISKTNKTSIPTLWSIVLSCCYALTAYNILYSSWPVYFDTIMILPLLAIGVEEIAVKGKKSALFVILMSFSIISCYYIAYMALITLSIYCIFLLIEEYESGKNFARRFGSYIFHCILSVFNSMIIILPAVLDFRRGQSSGSNGVSQGSLIKFGLSSVIEQLLPMSYSDLGLNQPPKVYCSILAVILALVYMIKAEKIRNKIAASSILVIYFLSFMISPLNRIWHGFKDPTGYSCRYAFSFCFFLLVFAVKGLNSLIKSAKTKSFFISFLIPCVLSIYTITELTLNTSFLVSRLHEDYSYNSDHEYQRLNEIMDNCLAEIKQDNNSDFYRTAKNFSYSSSDNLLYGYNGFEIFSSSFNESVVNFCRNMGMYAVYNCIDTLGLTPPVAGLLDTKYYISYMEDMSDQYEHISDYKTFHIYRNDTALPLAFEVADITGLTPEAFVNDPYQNINTVYKELFSTDRNIYEAVSHSDDYQENFINTSFTTDKSGHYWFYRNTSSSSREHTYLDYYLNGELINSYFYINLEYCSDLGSLQEETDYTLTMESSNNQGGDIYLYYLDMEALNDIYTGVNAFQVTDNNRNGIALTGSTDKDSTLFISLPYEKGYTIYNNGIKTDYSSYRDTFITIPIHEGANDILIKYFTPGLKGGLIISIISVLISAIYLSNIRKKLQK